MKKKFLVLCLAARSATAQDIGTGLMPDGSADTYVGASLRSSSPYLKGDARSISVVPVLHILCANGIFISSFGTAGWQLSDTPGVEYGPLFNSRNERAPTDSWQLAGTQRIRGTPDAGVFFNYALGDALWLRSGLTYDSNARGLAFSAGVQKTWARIAPHQNLTLSLGLSAANGQVMRQQYGVTSGDGNAPGPGDYLPNGGLASVNAGIDWNWAFNRNWLLNGGANVSHLGAAAADSPFISQPNLIRYSAGLAYRF